MNPVYAGLGTTIFEEMSGLARAHGAINLGQGFPDGDGPADVRQAAADALFSASNQYPPMMGLGELRAAVAAHYARHQALPFGADDVLVTSGATAALAAAILARGSDGDEVLLIQPSYDAYLPLVRRAGGTARFLSLAPPDWRLTAAAVDAAFAASPKVVIFNNPLNPAGRAFDRDEVALLAAACQRHGTIALCDEVWEHVMFDGRRHHPLIAEPGMAERAIKIGSAGKIFSMTGWKVGFVIAAPALLQPIARAQLCLSCHMGTKDRMITHRIMGAGHPRLAFELDTFTWLHPHYKIGEAWTKRKGDWNGVRDWAVGQGVAAENLLDLVTDEKAGPRP